MAANPALHAPTSGVVNNDVLVEVPGAALAELATTMDSLWAAVREAQDDVTEQIRSGGTPDFDGPYHHIFCRACLAVLETEFLTRLGRGLPLPAISAAAQHPALREGGDHACPTAGHTDMIRRTRSDINA